MLLAGGVHAAAPPGVEINFLGEDTLLLARPHEVTGQAQLVSIDLAAALPEVVYTSADPEAAVSIALRAGVMVYTLPNDRIHTVDQVRPWRSTLLPHMGRTPELVALNTIGTRLLAMREGRLETADLQIGAVTWPLPLEGRRVTAVGASVFRLFVGDDTGLVTVYDLDYGRLVDRFQRGAGAVTAFASREDELLVAGYADGLVVGWALMAGSVAWEITPDGTGGVTHMAMSRREDILTVSRSSATPTIVRGSLGTIHGSLPNPTDQKVVALDVSNEGRVGVLWDNAFAVVYDGEVMMETERVYLP